MSSTTFRTLSGAFCALWAAMASFGAEIALKEIVVAPDAVKAARLAACELQHVIRLSTGTALPVVTEPTGTGGRLFVGAGAGATKAGLPGKPFVGEEYLIAFRADDVYLLGHDDDDRSAFDYDRESTFPADTFCYRSTTYAVYDFLERHLGVRFYGFGDEGIACKAGTRAVVTSAPDLRRRPFMDAERRPYFSGRAAWIGVSPRDQRLLAFRWRQNAMFATVNHSVLDFWFRFWKKSPCAARAHLFVEARHDYFAKGYAGKFASSSVRGDYPDDADLPPQLCTSNPDVVKIIAEDAEKVHSGRGKDIYAGNFTKRMADQPFFLPLQEQDSEEWCKCAACTANEKLKNYDYRHFDWTARAARAVAARNPDLGIATLAYGQTLARPAGVDLPPNLAVKMCLGVEQWFQPRVYAKEHGLYRDWMDHEGRRRVMTLWLYLLNPTCSVRTMHKFKGVFPVMYPHAFGRYFSEFCRDGVRGWFAEIDPLAHMLEAYLGAKLSDDPSLGPEALIDEYYRRYYGAAGATMRRLCDRFEEISQDVANHTQSIRTIPPQVHISCLFDQAANWHLLTRERVDELDALYRRAVAEAQTPAEKARVKRFGELRWNEVPAARAEWEKLVKIRAIPLPHGVAFPEPRPEGRLRLDRTPENVAAKLPGETTVMTDGRRLFFSYVEKDDGATAHADLSGWLNGLELYLAGKHDAQYLHLMVPPKGKGAVICNRIIGDVRRTERPPIDLGIRSLPTKKGWKASFSVPLEAVPSFDGKKVFLHVFRTRRWKGGESLAWSPVFNEIYVAGLDRMGELTLSPRPPTGDWRLPTAFVSSDGKTPDGWVVQGLPLQAGESASTRDGVFSMTGGPRWLYVYREKDFRPVTSDHQLVFEFEARGTEGKDAWAVAGAYFVCGEGHGAGHQFNWEKLTSEWKPHRVVVDVKDTVAGSPVTAARAVLGVSPGTHAEIRKLRISTKRKDDVK